MRVLGVLLVMLCWLVILVVVVREVRALVIWRDRTEGQTERDGTWLRYFRRVLTTHEIRRLK